MDESALTVFVNGVFNPKEEDRWAVTKGILEGIFKCKAMHVHNATLGFDPERLLEENRPFALGIAAVMAGAAAFYVYKNAQRGETDGGIVRMMDKMESTLESNAVNVSRKMEDEIAAVLRERTKVKRVSIVAHSHGGWVTRNFIRDGYAAKIAADHEVKIDVYILGCPVLVENGLGIHSLLQLHNEDDLVSLHFSADGSKAPQVLSDKQGYYHSSHSYLLWLEKVIASSQED